MANFFLSPNMNLVIPVPTVDPGPDWAQNLNASLTILDAHNHSAGSGVQITPNGINLNADLSFNQNNAINLRSVRFTPQVSPLALVSDIGCLYESGVDLFYNDGSGNQVRITQGGSVSGSPGTITGLPSGTASAAFNSIQGTFTFQRSTGVGANLDAASLIIRYPGSYPTPSGNFIILEAPSSLSSGYAITLPALPISNSFLTLNTSGAIGTITQTGGITGSNIASTTITAANIANATITTTQIASSTILGSNIAANTVSLNNLITPTASGSAALGQIGISGSFGIVPGNNLTQGLASTNITVRGGPVRMLVLSDGSGIPYSWLCGGGDAFVVSWVRNPGSVTIASFRVSATSTMTISSSFEHIDYPGPNTYTYVLNFNGGLTTSAVHGTIAVYEIR